jgi:hypothetical protein
VATELGKAGCPRRKSDQKVLAMRSTKMRDYYHPSDALNLTSHESDRAMPQWLWPPTR